MNSKISAFISFSSLAGVLFFVVYTIWHLKVGLEISTTTEDLMYEIGTMVFMVPLLVPALFGLFYFRKRPEQWTKTVFTYYALYLFALVLAICVLIIPFDDPLARGLPMVLMILPASVILSVLLLVRLLTGEHK